MTDDWALTKEAFRRSTRAIAGGLGAIGAGFKLLGVACGLRLRDPEVQRRLGRIAAVVGWAAFSAVVVIRALEALR